ncbi:MAG: alkaline phosphatase family protein, partial [Planctomycetes bacterium]|nr:alkaline phosphatase family protein [Planctomycetota bacterium]
MKLRTISLAIALAAVGLADVAWLVLRPARTRVVLVGFDGLDWAVVDPLAARGEMPNLERLRRAGSSGPLRSMQPMLSPILWTSMATGKTADKHGIGWFGVENPNTHEFQPIQSTARKVQAIWNIASDEGRTVGVVNWYASYPAEVVSGFVVTNYFGSHAFGMTGERVRVSAGKTYPESLFDEVESTYERHARIAPEDLRRFASTSDGEIARLATLAESERAKDPLALLHDTIAAADGTAATTIALDHRFAPDLLLAYFDLTDAAAHLFMRYRPPPLAWVDRERQARFAGVVDEVYRRADRLLGEILDEVGPRAIVIVVSDHGFKSGDDRPAGDPERDVDAKTAAEWHRPDGVICAAGPGVRAGYRIEGASILDVTPTLLYALDLAVARDMDGKPLLEMFDEPFRKAHTLERIAS